MSATPQAIINTLDHTKRSDKCEALLKYQWKYNPEKRIGYWLPYPTNSDDYRNNSFGSLYCPTAPKHTDMPKKIHKYLRPYVCPPNPHPDIKQESFWMAWQLPEAVVDQHGNYDDDLADEFIRKQSEREQREKDNNCVVLTNKPKYRSPPLYLNHQNIFSVGDITSDVGRYMFVPPTKSNQGYGHYYFHACDKTKSIHPSLWPPYPDDVPKCYQHSLRKHIEGPFDHKIRYHGRQVKLQRWKFPESLWETRKTAPSLLSMVWPTEEDDSGDDDDIGVSEGDDDATTATVSSKVATVAVAAYNTTASAITATASAVSNVAAAAISTVTTTATTITVSPSTVAASPSVEASTKAGPKTTGEEEEDFAVGDDDLINEEEDEEMEGDSLRDPPGWHNLPLAQKIRTKDERTFEGVSDTFYDAQDNIEDKHFYDTAKLLRPDIFQIKAAIATLSDEILKEKESHKEILEKDLPPMDANAKNLSEMLKLHPAIEKEVEEKVEVKSCIMWMEEFIRGLEGALSNKKAKVLLILIGKCGIHDKTNPGTDIRYQVDEYTRDKLKYSPFASYMSILEKVLADHVQPVFGEAYGLCLQPYSNNFEKGCGFCPVYTPLLQDAAVRGMTRALSFVAPIAFPMIFMSCGGWASDNFLQWAIDSVVKDGNWKNCVLAMHGSKTFHPRVCWRAECPTFGATQSHVKVKVSTAVQEQSNFLHLMNCCKNGHSFFDDCTHPFSGLDQVVTGHDTHKFTAEEQRIEEQRRKEKSKQMRGPKPSGTAKRKRCDAAIELILGKRRKTGVTDRRTTGDTLIGETLEDTWLQGVELHPWNSWRDILQDDGGISESEKQLLKEVVDDNIILKKARLNRIDWSCDILRTTDNKQGKNFTNNWPPAHNQYIENAVQRSLYLPVRGMVLNKDFDPKSGSAELLKALSELSKKEKELLNEIAKQEFFKSLPPNGGNEDQQYREPHTYVLCSGLPVRRRHNNIEAKRKIYSVFGKHTVGISNVTIHRNNGSYLDYQTWVFLGVVSPEHKERVLSTIKRNFTEYVGGDSKWHLKTVWLKGRVMKELEKDTSAFTERMLRGVADLVDPIE